MTISNHMGSVASVEMHACWHSFDWLKAGLRRGSSFWFRRSSASSAPLAVSDNINYFTDHVFFPFTKNGVKLVIFVQRLEAKSKGSKTGDLLVASPARLPIGRWCDGGAAVEGGRKEE
ncbi:hypothetical protein NL676_035540 [Syzygium grande]|nr:hypothetical protein NL676_035540 [Syzygium grande]